MTSQALAERTHRDTQHKRTHTARAVYATLDHTDWRGVRYQMARQRGTQQNEGGGTRTTPQTQLSHPKPSRAAKSPRRGQLVADKAPGNPARMHSAHKTVVMASMQPREGKARREGHAAAQT